MPECIFCKIAQKETKAEIVAENDVTIAFKDANPKAPVHILVIPKRHIASLTEVSPEDQETLGSILMTVSNVAKSLGLNEGGYKVVANVGRGAGQAVGHLHFHILGGWGKQYQQIDV